MFSTAYFWVLPAVLFYAVIVSLYVILHRSTSIVWKFFSLIFLVGALYLMFLRDTYLPFLGVAAMPASILKEEMAPENSNVKVRIPIQGQTGDRVIYWGANPNKNTVSNPKDAYGHFNNAGIVYVAEDGYATLRFHCPAKYSVPWGKTLGRHVHYRVFGQGNAMMGRVETVYVDC